MAHENLQSWINQDIEVIQKRLLDSEIGQRAFEKSKPEPNRHRLIQTGMGTKSPDGTTNFGDIMNSGKSIVMSKVHKVTSPPAVDQKTELDEQQ